MNLLALIAAGHVREDDDTLGIMQNVSREHAHSIGKWLALATGGPVHLRLIGIGESEDISYTPEQVRAAIKGSAARAELDEGRAERFATVDAVMAELAAPDHDEVLRASKCPHRPEHQMEPEWKGGSYAFMKCRWCDHREPV